MQNTQPTLLYQHSPHLRQTSRRGSAAAAVRLTERDLALLHELFTARYLTTPQIVALFWRTGHSISGRRYACQRRLLQLTKSRLIRRIEVPVTRSETPKPYIYTLDRKGAELLIAELGIEPQEVEWRPKSSEANFPFLDHLLATNEVRINLSLASKRHLVSLTTWVNEKELKSEGMKDTVTLVSPDGQKEQKAAVVPDAYFALQVGLKQAHFFVEIDRGTVTIAPTLWERRGWARKVRAYQAYFTSGLFQKRYAARAFRVMCITTSGERLHNLRAVTQREKGGGMFWFATFEHLTPKRFLSQPIWISAASDTPQAILE